MLNADSMVADDYNELREIFVKEGDAASARAWFEQALLIFEKLENKKNAAIVRENLAKLAVAESADAFG